MVGCPGRAGPPARDPPPRFRGERCLHHRHLAAGCVACIAICPRDALQFDRRGVRLDPGRCDGCGLCAAVCPEAAFEMFAEPLLGEHRGRPAAFFACGRVRDETPARISCLHASGLRDLTRLRDQGVRLLVVAEAPCGECPRHPGTSATLVGTIGRLARLLRSRGIPALELEVLPPGAFARALARAGRVDPGKRRLLRRGSPAPPAAGSGPALHPFVPVFDARSCVGCDACVRVCPHGALELIRDREGTPLAYRARAEDCSGCGLCADVCEEEAITVEHDRPVAGPVVLRAFHCSCCGARFHEPEGPSRASLCRVCRRIGAGRSPLRVVE